MTLTGTGHALVVDGLSVRYRERAVLKDVHLSLGERGVSALIGPSGCGKSTLLFALNRLLDLVPGAVVSGSVRLKDTDVLAASTDVTAVRRKIGMVFQRPVPFAFSIEKNIAFPLREHGITDRAEVRARVERALVDVGLWDEVKDDLSRPATALSGGQQQRLCIARAVALEPQVLLLDEPTSALDPGAAARVEELIVTLGARYPILIVTHNLAQARRIAADTAFLYVVDGVGTVIEAAKTTEIFGNPRDTRTRDYVVGRFG